MDAYLFERSFVQVISELANRKGFKHAQLAKLAWPHQKGAATAWRKIRNNAENPKRLNLEEALLLCQTLGMSITDICGIVQGRMLGLNHSQKADRQLSQQQKN